MVILRTASQSLLGICFAALMVLPSLAQAQHRDRVLFQIEGPTQRLELTVNSSRIMKLERKIPRAQVANPDLIRLQPLSPNQIQIAAIKPGVTQVNIWDEDDNVHTIDVVVYGDARELEMLLANEFPNSSLKVKPLSASVVVSGYVDRPEVVSRVIRMAEDYYPKVINNITVGGVQQVLLKVKVMEVSRTKLRTLGVDWAALFSNDFIVSGVSGLASTPGTDLAFDTLRFGIVDGSNSFFAFIEALRKNDLLKLLSEPTLVTVSGRPASFNVGGEFPIIVPQSLGTVSVEYKQFGTRVDFVPIVLGNGNVRLEVRPQVSEIDSARSVTVNNTTIPGLRSRWVDTAVEMKAGQTLVLAGLLQNRVESQNKGVPFLADLPYFGVPFRRETEEINEIELLIMVRPEFVDALDPHEVPAKGPGEFTTSPKDWDFYMRGHMEVPATDANVEYIEAGHQGGEALSLPTPSGDANIAPTPADAVEPPVDPSALRRFLPLDRLRASAGNVAPTAPVVADQLPVITTPSAVSSQHRIGATQSPNIPRPTQASSRRQVSATPVGSSRPSNRQDRQTPSGGNNPLKNTGGDSIPGFIGPVGYGDLK